MNVRKTLFALALLGAAGVAQAAPNCTVKIKGGDNMQFDLKTATVSAACKSISFELQHTGKLPVAAMGHNIVLTETASKSASLDSGHYAPDYWARALEVRGHRPEREGLATVALDSSTRPDGTVCAPSPAAWARHAPGFIG